jgi:hypothetical protein
VDASELWSGFGQDPRDPAHAGLRASDADRERIQGVLTDAFADGRLDPAEHDERTTALVAARTLGDLPPLVADLVASGPVTGTSGLVRRATPGELEQRAVRHWEAERRQAVLGFLGPTLITWVIWSAVMFGQFPWPLFVMLGTGINLARTVTGRDEIVDRERRRLEKKQARLDDQA